MSRRLRALGGHDLRALLAMAALAVRLRAERHLVEAQADVLEGVIERVLGALALTPDQAAQARGALAEILGSVGTCGPEGPTAPRAARGRQPPPADEVSRLRMARAYARDQAAILARVIEAVCAALALPAAAWAVADAELAQALAELAIEDG